MAYNAHLTISKILVLYWIIMMAAKPRGKAIFILILVEYSCKEFCFPFIILVCSYCVCFCVYVSVQENDKGGARDIFKKKNI